MAAGIGTGSAATAMARTISICDRESDVYEYLTYKQRQQQRFVVRASRN